MSIKKQQEELTKQFKEQAHQMKKMEIIYTLDSLRYEDSSGSLKPLVKMNGGGIDYIADVVSPSEYIDQVAFLEKLLEKLPLLRNGAEKKEKLEERDFVFYR